jgi:hypothetical protein
MNKNTTIFALVIFLFVFTIGLVGFIFFFGPGKSGLKPQNRTEYRVGNTDNTPATTDADYVPLGDGSSAPEEVNDATVEELDSLMKGVDNTSGDTLDDISL